MLTAADVAAGYGSVTVIRSVSLDIGRGERVAVVGRSGSGKSTLLLTLAGIVPATAGRIAFDGHDYAALDARSRARLRRERFGFVFQASELVPELTLAENVALPLRMVGHRRSEAVAAATALLESMGIGAVVARRRPRDASGGEQQRAAVARACITSPDVVFADEPTGALDATNGSGVLDLLFERVGGSLVVVTHDPSTAQRADRVVRIDDGELVAP